MKLKDITVLIPTIGRDTISESIKSIPPACNITIMLDPGVPNYLDKFENLRSMIHSKYYLEYDISLLQLFGISGPGEVKQRLIESVKTDYFIILDDDDYFHKYFLSYCLSMINSVDYKVSWIATHWVKSDDAVAYNELAKEFSKVDLEFLNDRYWDWIDGNRDYNYTKSHIYPSTEVLINTKDFMDFQYYCQENESKFKFKILDDTVPILNFMTKYVGINHEGVGIFYHQTDNSVSRTRLNKSLKSEVETVIGIMSGLYLKTRNKIWLRAIYNALRVCDFNFNFNKK